ncbi:hypothetical protein K457DRAFT_835881 [Linnemannia elongata AG-77]|uniref:Uncharacterized protein n=1 Tax=Linnemannia elongata AG-77 TaxID=1314771 RepID=A0A197JJ13_9FUNG|nr:hypothetical protein K457DRAFT_835881 [Linnemannia elongata AG-77]
MKQRNMEGQRETDRTGTGHDRTRQGNVDPMTIHNSDSTLVFHLHSDRRTHTQSNHVIDPSLLLLLSLPLPSSVSLDSLALGVSVTNLSLFRPFRLLRIFSCVALRSLAKLVLYVSKVVGPRKFAMRLFYLFFYHHRLFPRQNMARKFLKKTSLRCLIFVPRGLRVVLFFCVQERERERDLVDLSAQ